MKFKIIHLFAFIFSCILLSAHISAYYVHYPLGSAYCNIGIADNLSTSYSAIFDNAISIWNNGISDRTFIENSGAVNSIIDLDYRDAVDINSQLGFLFYDRYRALGYYKSWAVGWFW